MVVREARIVTWGVKVENKWNTASSVFLCRTENMCIQG